MAKKLTIEYVKKFYKDVNYLYLSTTYVNNKTKELVQCPEGHQYEVCFANFQQGVRCPVCYHENQKLEYEYVRKYIEGFGYVLLSKIYVNNNTKLLIQCPEGHQYEVKFNHFKTGQRCPECAGVKKLEYEYVRKYIEGFGYVLLSKIYVNNSTKLLIQCPKGHQYEVSFANFKNGSRCPICDGKKKLEYEYVKKYFKDRNYLYLSTTYTNNKTKELVQCPLGHQYEVKFNHFKNGGSRCPVCNNEKTSSKAEIEIQELVKTLTNTTVICNDRTKIINTNTGNNLELDIYFPYLNKAIEYNGTYWHLSKEVKMKDQMKIDQCKNLGIDLLVINEADYINNKEQTKNKIKQWLLVEGV